LLGNENSFEITYVHLESHDKYKISAGNAFLPQLSFRITVICLFPFVSEIFLQSFLRHGIMGAAVDDRPVFFFDIDNCLYPRSRMVHDHMQRLINVCIFFTLSSAA
jgi:hypothetical protein